jgi:hypothetical protein
VGKKFISLDACSILTAYRGVGGEALALTPATARDTIAAPISARYSFLFIFSPLHRFNICKKVYYKYFLCNKMENNVK